jgi:hypothetical protein
LDSDALTGTGDVWLKSHVYMAVALSVAPNDGARLRPRGPAGGGRCRAAVIPGVSFGSFSLVKMFNELNNLFTRAGRE